MIRTFRSQILPAACACGLAAACGGGAAATADLSLYPVVRRDLQITIKENAELQAQRETVVRSQVEGQTTIIYLIEEGRIVEQGEKLVELDASELVDKRDNQAITVAKAEDGLTQASKALEILEKELKTKINTAEGNLRIAEMELEKFLGRQPKDGRQRLGKNGDMVDKLRELVEPPAAATEAAAGPDAPPAGPAADGEATAPAIVSQVDPRKFGSLVPKVSQLLDVEGDTETLEETLERDMGDMANQVLQQVDKIRLAMADLKYQEAYFGHSRELAKKKFLTPNELEKDQIEYQRRLSQVALAWNDLDLLISYELLKNRIKLIQDVENARLERDRVIASNEAERTKADSELRTRQDEYNLSKGRLDNLEKQIANAVVHAPTPGLVIYARLERDRRGSESIREGTQVRERQDLIILPDTTRMQAIVKVQEAVVAQVKLGQPAHVVAEARSDRVYTGHVTRVAQQADSNSGWMTSDRKVYTTVVAIDGENPDSELKSRMAASVTILVDELHDVLAVPLQAVRRDRSVNYVWKQTPDGPQAVVVGVGRHNAEHVVIGHGLAEGDVVYLTQPPGAQPPNLAQPEVPMPALDAPPPAAATGANAGDGTEPGGDRRGRGGPGPGNGGRGPRMGIFGSKKLAEMTPEELGEFKAGLGMMRGMIERWRENGDQERAERAENGLTELEAALEQGKLDVAQAVVDRLRSTMRPARGNGGGQRGGGPGERETGDGGPDGEGQGGRGRRGRSGG
jgi:multidrug resistance efflux pump